MIGRLAGVVLYRTTDHVCLDVRGVGYLIYGSDRTLAAVPAAGEAVALYTDLLVREDNLQLFGFLSLQEKEWHRLLMGVQGVGAKAALAIQGTLGPEGVSRAIALGDWGAVAKAKGVGPKIGQRVVAELKDKAPSVMALTQSASTPAVDDDAVIEDVAVPTAKPAPQGSGGQAEALSALTNLGYSPSEAASAVAEAAGENGSADTPTLIRLALRKLAPQG